MNPEIEHVLMILSFEAYNEENPFTKEQREALVKIMDEAKTLELNPHKPFKSLCNFRKIRRCFDDYEALYKLFGGDANKLEDKLKEIRANKLKAVSELFIPKV